METSTQGEHRGGAPTPILDHLDEIKRTLGTPDPNTGELRTQRWWARKLGVTESGISRSLHRDRERQGMNTYNAWGRQLPWRVPTREHNLYIYKMLVLYVQRQAGRPIGDKDLADLHAFEAKLARPEQGAPMGLVVFWDPEAERWTLRPREPEDGPEPYVER